MAGAPGGTRSARGLLAASQRNIILTTLFSSMWTWNMLSVADECAGTRMDTTVLFLQKKGPEVAIQEVNITSGLDTGLRKSFLLHGAAIAGFALDSQLQTLYVLPSSPPIRMERYSFTSQNELEYVNSTTLSTSGNLGSETLVHIWNVIAWENRGYLLAAVPTDSGFNTSVVSVDTTTGMVSTQLSLSGAPIRGIFTFDRQRERYFLVTAERDQRNLVTFFAAEQRAEVSSFPLAAFGELVGIHYDEVQCRMVGLFLRAPGVLSVKTLDNSESIVSSVEVTALSPAVSLSVQAKQLIGATALVNGVGGTEVMVRDPVMSLVSVFRLDSNTRYTIQIVDDSIVTFAIRVSRAPRIESVLPSTAGMTGASRLTLTGSDFGLRDLAAVAYVGDTAVSSVEWFSDTSLSVSPVASGIAGVAFPFRLDVYGNEAMPTTFLVEYVPSWTSVTPTEASVVGGTVLTFTGGRFGGGNYECKFGNVLRVAATPSGSTTITCTVPAWPLPAGPIQLDILVDGSVMRRDTDELYPYVAGDVTQLTVGVRPDVAQGGQFFDRPFQVLVRDAAGNINLQYTGDIEVKFYSLSSGVASAVNMTDVYNTIQGSLLVGVSGGAANFSLSIARHGTYILSFFTSQCGCCLPVSTATGCFRFNATLEVEIGSVAALTVQSPSSQALAGLPFFFQPVVQVRDSGGNIANVSLAVQAYLSPQNSVAGLVASDAVSVEGVAVFTDLQISANGTYTVVFSIASGPTVNTTVHILHSRPTYLFNSGGRPTNMHVAMQPIFPPPTIWLLDAGGNRIIETYWIQDQYGTLGERNLDVTVTAVLSTAFENITTTFPGAAGTSQLAPPYPLPSGLTPPPNNGNLFSTVSVRVRSDPSLQPSCPALESCTPFNATCSVNVSCSANASSWNCSSSVCYGHGSCSAAGTCNCSSDWQGEGCWLPSERVLCGEDCESLLGRWENGTCGCFPSSATAFEVTQYGSAAVFDNLLIDSQATGYVMLFVSEGLEPARSFAFTVVSGKANHLWVISHPMQSNGGEPFANPPLVEIRDAGRNMVTKASDGANITIEVTLVDAPSTAILSGVLVRRASDGHAFFPGLSVDLATVYAGGEYRLQFFAEDLIEAYTEPFPVYIGEPNKFVVLTHPDLAVGGQPFVIQPVLELRDRGNNRVNQSSGWSVNATLDQGGNASVSGTVDADFVQGVARFSDLEVNFFGTGYRIRFQVPTLSSVLSAPFDVTIGAVAGMFLFTQPERAIGGVLQVQPVLGIVDQGGNVVVAGNGRNVTVFLTQPDLTADIPVGEPEYVVGPPLYQDGLIRFTDLSLSTSGNGYQFVFTSPGLPTLTSDPFNNTLGAPFSASIAEEPGNVIAGSFFSRQPVIELLDQGGNFVPADGVNVSTRLNATFFVPLNAPFATTLPEQNWNGSGCSLHVVIPTLFGTTSLLSSVGLVEFTGLTVNMAGAGYFLEFFSPTVLGSVSSNFSVSPGEVAISLHVLCQPTVEFGGDVFVQQPVIDFLDSGGNRINDQTQQVRVVLDSSEGNTTLSGVLFSESYGDLAAFTNLAIDTAGSGYILRFESANLFPDETFPFSVLPGPAVAVTSFLVPDTVDAGEPQAMNVTVADKGGNGASSTGTFTAVLFEVFEETRVYRCTGTSGAQHSCDVALNASIPAGAKLMSAVLSADILCTDLDFQTEQVTSVTVGSYPLSAGSEFSTGPWAGCSRSCSQTRSVVNELDLVRTVCWDSNDAACDRMLYSESWNRNETRWEHLQALTQQDIGAVPLRIEISEDVNFHPCDGSFLSTNVQLLVKWALPASSGALAGDTVVTMNQGVAHFTDLVVFDANVSYTLGFRSPGLRTAFLERLTVVPGPVRKLQIAVQPGNGTGNSTLSPQPVVLLLDNGNNTVVGASGVDYTVYAQLMIAENAASVPPSPLLGMSVLEAAKGVAAFTDLFVGAQSDGFTYLLRFSVSVNGTDAVASQNFSVMLGPLYGMWVEEQPSGVFGGDAFEVQPKVYAGDWSENLVPNVEGVVSAQIGTNGGLSGVLSGQKTAVLTGSQATFVNLTLDRAGQGYTLMFFVDGLVFGETAPFEVQKGNATQLAVERQPSDGIVMRLLGVQPKVVVQDNGGNKISDWDGNITVEIGREGSAIHPTLATNVSSTLIGTTTGLLFNGAGYFWNLRIDKMGLGFALTFSAGAGIRNVTSIGFDIFGDTATSLRILVQPSMARTSLRMSEIVVAAQDDNGDIDGAFAIPASANLIATDGSATPQMYNATSILFANGLAIFDSVQVAEAAGQLQMNFSASGFSVVSDVFDIIEAFTGWWGLTYDGDDVQLAMRRDPASMKVSASWQDAATSADVSYSATHVPEIDLENACMTVAGATYSAGRGMSSAYFEHCDQISMTGLSADIVATELDTAALYGKDVQHLAIEENYPTTQTVHYILVANAFNSTSSSYTLDSALYKWDSGTFTLHQTFPSTKGATSWEYFKMGGANYLVVANHFDDSGNGYGTPSIIYEQAWDQGEGKQLFTAIQSVSGSGAVVWKHFNINGFDYLAVANYFNGSDFNINSKVYKLERTNPDTLVPRTTPVQKIPTSGARDLTHFSIDSMDYIAFANRWGGSVAVYRWSSSTEMFVHFQDINTTAPMGVDAFVIDGVQYLAIANVARENSAEPSSNSSIHIFDPSSGFALFQDLPTKGASFIRALYNDEEQLLTLSNVHDPSITNGTCDVYKWDGSRFRPYFELPTTHAYALTVLTAPCATNNPGGPLCDGTSSERMVIAVNGIGSGMDVFRVSSLNATSYATHLRITSDGLFSDTQVGVVITPDVVALLMRFTVLVTNLVGIFDVSSAAGLFDTQQILADADVSSYDSPTGMAGSKVAPMLWENLQVVTVAGIANFSNISATSSGNTSIRAFNEYLNDVFMARTNEFFVSPGSAHQLQRQGHDSVYFSGSVLSVLVSVHDRFGNLLADASGATITATPFGNSSITLSSDTSLTTINGVANFNIQIDGNDRGASIVFESSGLQSVVSAEFDVIATTQATALPPSDLVFSGATITSTGDFIFLFGGLNASVPTATVVQLQTTSYPFTFQEIAVSGSVPAGRYRHASVGIELNGVSTLFICGGTDGASVFSDSFVLPSNTLVWSSVQTSSPTARQRHGAVSGSILQDGTSTVVSFVAVFGGLDGAGNALAALELYRVFLYSVQQVAPVVVTGDIPSARYDFVMAWTSGRGFVLGGEGLQASTLYSFMVSFDGSQYSVQWTMTVPDPGNAAAPYRSLVTTPAYFDSKIYLLATTSASDTSGKLFGLDVDAYPSPEWLETSSAGLPAAGIYQFVEVAEGKFVIVQSDFTNLTSSSRRLLQSSSFVPLVFQLSLVGSERLLLVSSTNPTSGSAGLELTPQPLVNVVDAGGATVAGVGSFASIFADAFDSVGDAVTLGGTSLIQAQDGVAQFTDLSVDTNTSNVILRFSSPALFSVDSAPFTVVRGPAAILIMTRQPFGVFLGQTFFVQPVVELQDTSGNKVIEDSFSTVTAKLQRSTASGFVDSSLLSGTLTIALSRGVAMFADLAIGPSATAGTTYRIVVSRSGVISASSNAFTFTDASGTQVSFVSAFGPSTGQCVNQSAADSSGCAAYSTSASASNTGIAMVPFASQPSFEIIVSDTALRFRHDAGLFFTASLITTTNETALPNSFYGNTSAEANAGVVTFTDLGVRRAGSNFVIRFESAGFPTLDSTAFTVVPGTPAMLILLLDATNSLAGLALLQQPAVSVSDAGGNPVSVVSRVVASLWKGAVIRQLGGDLEARTTNGIAMFTDLAVDAAENDFKLLFSLTDSCCGKDLNVSGGEFNISTSIPSQLTELVSPAGGTGAVPFTTQPQVGVLDAGGNLITGDNGTEVTAYLFRDETMQLAVKQGIPINGLDIVDLEHFVVNGSDYIVAAMYYDQTTYAVNSILYRWDPDQETLVQIQTILTNGASAWTHVEFDGDHYLFLANSFEEVSVVSGVILGTYITDSKIFRFSSSTEELLEVDSFQTEGAEDIAAFSVGSETFVAVANSFNDTSTDIMSVLYSFDGSATPNMMTQIQTLSTQSASVFHSFSSSAGTFLAVGMYYSESATSYVTASHLYRFLAGELELLTTFQTSGVVAIQSFSVETRTFLAVANSVDPDGSLAGGSVDVYEFDGGSLTLQQSFVSLPGVTALSNFYVNDAQWLAVATNPVSGGNSPSLILLSWEVSNCSATFLCDVNFTIFEELAIDDCRSVVHFRAGSNNYIVYGGSGGLDTVSFQSSATLSGTKTAHSVNGIATFTDLALDLAQADYVLSYESPGLFTAIGASFAVVAGPADSLLLQQTPSGALGGTAFATQPIVALVDAGGNVLTDFAGTLDVDANISASGQASSLRGRSSVAVRMGVAAFTDLGITTATWSLLSFAASGYSNTDVNITVEVGTSYQLALQAGSANAFGGVAFGSQPSLWVVDRGGNLVSSDSSTRVAVALHQSSIALEEASSADILTATVDDSAFFLLDGVGYVAAVSSSDTTIYKWGCTGPVPHQTVSAGGDVLEVFNYDEVLWLLIADSASSVQIYAYSTNFTLQSSVPGEVNALVPILIGDAQYIAVARTTGTVLYSWTKPDGTVTGTPHEPTVTLVQHISSLNGSVLLHISFNYKDYVLELAEQEANLYEWNGTSMSVDEAIPYSGLGLSGFSITAGEVYYASGSPRLAIADTDGDLSFMDLEDPASAGSVSILNNYGGKQVVAKGATGCSVKHAVKGSKHLVVFACVSGSAGLYLFQGNGSAGGYTEIFSTTASFSSVSFLLSEGHTYLLAFGGSPGASATWRVGGNGTLSGSTLSTASAGVVLFTDLAIDVVSSYDLSFAPETLYPIRANPQDYTLSQAYDLGITVSLGIPDGLVQESAIRSGETPAVRVVDAGGNSLMDVLTVTAVLDSPSNYSTIKEVDRVSSTGARDAESFKIDGTHYVAIANNFDGTSFNVESTVWRFSGGKFSSPQSLQTKGAYDFEAFSISTQAATGSGAGNKSLTHFLAVANHYDDVDGYQTESVIYRWNATLAKFQVHQSISTLGATSFAAFEVSGATYLAVSNFFDGTFHACNSAVYKWSRASDQFELLQQIETVGAHDVTYVQSGGRHYIAFAQYRDADEISLSLTSGLYRLDERSMQFTKVLNIGSSAAMHIEAFYINSTAFLAVANYANATTGTLLVDSTIYELGCDGGTDVLAATQAISTNGATHWRHFQRGGNHFLAVCHWVPDDLAANYVVVYLYDSGSFHFYTNTTSLGAFSVEFMFADNGYYLIETIPGDPVSVLNQFVGTNDAVQASASVSSASGVASFPAFSDEIQAYNYDGSVLNSVGLDFESDGLEGTSMGPYTA